MLLFPNNLKDYRAYIEGFRNSRMKINMNKFSLIYNKKGFTARCSQRLRRVQFLFPFETVTVFMAALKAR